jgi:hypothetical protein
MLREAALLPSHAAVFGLGDDDHGTVTQRAALLPLGGRTAHDLAQVLL